MSRSGTAGSARFSVVARKVETMGAQTVMAILPWFGLAVICLCVVRFALGVSSTIDLASGVSLGILLAAPSVRSRLRRSL
jgi:hypothetical protein